MDHKKVSGLLGLSKKAGFAKSGAFAAEDAVRRGKAGLVILARDASQNTTKAFEDLCRYHNVPLRQFGDKDELGHLLGLETRVVIAVTDRNMAAAILAAME